MTRSRRRAGHCASSAQNLAWALGLQPVAIPLAALGYLSPLVAALGMSASSLLVVANALRALSLRHALASRSETARHVAALQTACP